MDLWIIIAIIMIPVIAIAILWIANVIRTLKEKVEDDGLDEVFASFPSNVGGLPYEPDYFAVAPVSAFKADDRIWFPKGEPMKEVSQLRLLLTDEDYFLPTKVKEERVEESFEEFFIDDSQSLISDLIRREVLDTKATSTWLVEEGFLPPIKAGKIKVRKDHESHVSKSRKDREGKSWTSFDGRHMNVRKALADLLNEG